ncbi:leucine rich repeat family protein [Anaeramoeba flamelloides]|uniref:Leucine rich repeat family protein n=1 Tax=Anaeramoeba flamelloides TaxID=1746091 RepID=A0ABQ8ZDP2_9EUKA|nr:leucine rich repeat family protein [Anaeramoeba flamelloides]
MSKKTNIPETAQKVLFAVEEQNLGLLEDLFENVNIFDKSLGAFLGAGIGDSIGSYLEFIGHKPTEEETKKAMEMPGGGHWGVSSGMITDDTELAISLAHGLLNMEEGYDLDPVAFQYAQWIVSKPFDIGLTCWNSFSVGRKDEKPSRDLTERMQYRSEIRERSKANGSLMRTTPIPIYGHKLTVGEVAKLSQEDSALSHINPSCQHSVAAYNIAISYLINNSTDEDRNIKAFNVAKKWINENACEEVKEWMILAEKKTDIPYWPQAGFVKIAFVHSFRHLLLKTSYEDSIYETCFGGGDTDTNAAIVGGMMGAYWGIMKIPKKFISVSLNCVIEKRLKRDEKFNPNQIPDLVLKLLKKAPQEL